MENKVEMIGRYHSVFDWFGWLMCGIGIVLLCHFGGILDAKDKNWWYFWLCFLAFAEYGTRVAFGKVYKFITYESEMKTVYEVMIPGVNGSKRSFIKVDTEEELALYIESTHNTMEFSIIGKYEVEGFQKTEKYVA